MIKKHGKKIFLLLIVILAVVVIPMFVVGRDYGAEYDDVFGGEAFTIHTSEFSEEMEDWQLSSLVYDSVNNYSSNTLYEGDSRFYYRVFVNDCSVSNMTCDIGVNKAIDDPTLGFTEEPFKSYEDVKINVNSDVSSYFNSIVNEDGNIVIQYDESMFASDEEKNTYINNYLMSKQFTNNDGDYVSFSYNAAAKRLIYRIFSERSVGRNFYASTVINDVVFDNTEEAYSDDFKTLTTDGTVTIKSSSAITTAVLSNYLNSKHTVSGTGSLSFDLDGKVVNNKAYVIMRKYDGDGNELAREKHLITVVHDSNIDSSKFALVNMESSIIVPADRPTSDLDTYISYFMNAMHYRSFNVEEGNSNVYYSYDLVSDNDGSGKAFIKYTKDVDGYPVDIQYNEVTFNFTGYSDVYSEKFEAKYKNGMTVRADDKDFWTVSNNLEWGYTVLSCNEDTTVCDIALSHDEEKRMEIHKVNITFDNSISDKFKQLFGLNEDGTIDVITDTDLDDISYFSYYVYDDVSNSSLVYSREGNKMVLSLNPYGNGNDYEEHKVVYNIVDQKASAHYKNLVNMNKDFYPGENTDIWDNISYNYYFNKGSRNYEANTIGCDRSTNKCKVVLLNNKKLEIHEVTANIKTGKSSEFSAAFPDDNVVFNAIYKDDEQYLYGASMAYFMSKTKDYVYLREFTDKTAKVVFNELETHSFNVKYAEANEKHAEEIADAKAKLKKTDLTTVRKDLEFVNKFYYEDEFFLSSDNFNSKSLNDKFNKAVNNKHIGYYVVPEGGGGTPYMTGAAGRLVLFYDGIAYDILDGYVDFTNYNILYIPSNTEKTTEAYIRAAQKRVDEYLGEDSGVVITYNGPCEEGYFDDETFEEYGIDKNVFDYKEYKISHLGKSENMLIVADSSKMQKPDFAASDVTANISVTSNTVNYPSNTVVMSEVVDKEDSEYSKILEKAKVKNAHIVDINLYSSSVGDIDDFDGAEFNVSVPIEDEKLRDKDIDLVAYYIDDEGNVEEHPVVMDDFMATFETTHFSTYIIAEKTKADNIGDAAQDVIKNPNTGDNILTYILLLVLSGTVVGTASYRFIKREN